MAFSSTKSVKRSLLQACGLGLSAGCFGGALAGAAEGWWILRHSGGGDTIEVVAYVALLYGAAGAVAGLLLGLLTEIVSRVLQKGASDGRVYALVAGTLLAGMSFISWRFLVRRDIFHERLAWDSTHGLALEAVMVVAALLLIFLFWKFLGRFFDIFSKRFVLKPWFMPLVITLLCGSLLGWARTDGKRKSEVGLFSKSGSASAASTGADHARSLSSSKGPNIVLIMVDTLRADYTDPYGAKGLTPWVASLAKEGIVFKRAYTQSSWTRAALATVFSGRYPSSHKAIYKMDALPSEVETVAEVLKKGGYKTGAIVSNYVTSPYFGFAQGFDQYHYLDPDYFLFASDATSKAVLYEGLKKFWSRFVVKGSRPGAHYQDGKVVTDKAIEWLERWRRRAGKEERFFFFLQYMDPHDPYFAHPYDGTAIARKATPNPPPEWLGRMKKLYTGEVRYFDLHLGRLLHYMRKQPWWNDSVVILFSDHGEEFFEHGGWWHGETLYEEQIKVPLIVKLPGGEGAGRVLDSGLVGLIDIAPTICRLAGLNPPAGSQGIDLFEERAEPLFAELDHGGNSLRSVIYRKGADYWKVIVANEDNPRRLPPVSLFNLSSDPHEKKDLAVSNPADLREALEKLAAATSQAASGAATRTSIELDKASRDRLKDLGYIRD